MTGRQAHRTLTLALSIVMVAIGLALIGEVIGAGNAVNSGRLLLGVLFLAAGIGRTYITLKRDRRA
jgi:hypothetical protein